MKKAFYFFAVLLLLSCHHASQKGHTVSVRIDPDEAENSIAADEWLDTAGCALIPLADTEKPITNATRLKTHGGKIYILDEETHCLHVFHADGTLDFSIDRRGKAGNEYLWISDFHVTDECLYLLDHIGQKILECDTLGAVHPEEGHRRLLCQRHFCHGRSFVPRQRRQHARSRGFPRFPV